MSKVRTSGKSRRTVKNTTAMDDDDNNTEIVAALAKTLSMFDGSMTDAPTSPNTNTTTKATKKEKASQPQADTMGDEGNAANNTKNDEKKEKKIKIQETIVSAPIATELSQLLPKIAKVDRKVTGLNKEGSEMIKTRSKKERLKIKQRALLDHIQATHDVLDHHTAKTKSSRAGNLFTFSSDLSRALDDAEDDEDEGKVKKIKHNPLTSVLNGAGQWKNDKKSLKSLEQDKAKFQDVIQHPAFQSNSIGSIQQHLTNQMAMMRQIDENQNGSNHSNNNKKNDKKNQQGQNRINKLVKNDRSLASSMKK